jgi:signal transduction histidine kinase
MTELAPTPPALWARYRVLWPLGLLFAAEALAFGLAAAAGPLGVTRFSLTVAAAALLTGLIPALLRPNAVVDATTGLLAGCLAVIGASFLIAPFDLTELPRLAGVGSTASLLPALVILRLVNAAVLGPLALHLTARFPVRSALSDGHLAASYGISAIVLAALLLTPAGPRLPLAVAGFLWLMALLIGCLAQLFIASRGPVGGREARQARLLLLTLAVAYTPIMLRLLGFLWGRTVVGYEWLLVGQLVWPIGISYAILRHDLFGIDAALRRGLAYAVLSLALLAIYFGLTLLLTATLLAAFPQFRGAATLIALFVAAAAFTPLRQRAQWAIDRLFYPERLAFQAEVRAARVALAEVIGRAAVVALLAEQLPRRLGAAWGALTVGGEAHIVRSDDCAASLRDFSRPLGQPATEVTTTNSPAWGAALTVGGRMLGRWELGPRRPGPPFDADEQAQLHALAQQAGLALAYAETFDALNVLNRELEARIAERTAQVVDQQRALAVVAERQRLARDLHDSVTQTLFSISLGLRNARGLVRRDPDAAVVDATVVDATTAALIEQEAAARAALAEMRALLAQLRSPAPAETDLAAALREHCAGLERQGALVVALDLPATCPLPGAQAAELLAIAREALHNVVKHGGVKTAACTLAVAGDQITLTVSDGGRGFDPATSGGAGLGLRGMRERVAALGGTVEIASATGQGTTVRVQAPIPMS